MKKIRVLFEFPEKWVDLESPIGFISGTLKTQVWRSLRSRLVDEVMEHYEDVSLDITQEEIKNGVIAEIARRQVDRIENNDS